MSRERVVFDRITVDGKMHRQPCIRGHRFTVAHMVRLVAAGMDVEQIQQDFPVHRDRGRASGAALRRGARRVGDASRDMI